MASVLGQTFASFRLLVSDNASNDNTPDVVRRGLDQALSSNRPDLASTCCPAAFYEAWIQLLPPCTTPRLSACGRSV
jgi:hypothetical protein